MVRHVEILHRSNFGKLVVHELKPSTKQTEVVMRAWNADDYPGPDDEIVQPESESDLSEAELEAIQRRVEEDIARNGPPSDTDLMKHIDRLNKSAPK